MIDETEAYGLKFRFPARDVAVGAHLRDYGEFARPELDFLLAHADAPDGTLVDVGAHIGSVSLPFAKARPAWRVIAVEAAGPLAQLVYEGAVANALRNVEVLTVAAGEAAGIADYPVVDLTAKGNFGMVGFGSHETVLPRRKVGVRPLDDIAPADTRLIKVDVEGHEEEVLRGSARLLRETRPIWLMEAHRKWTDRTRAVADHLLAHDYRLFWFFSPFVTFKPARGVPANPGLGDLGLVAVPSDRRLSWDLPGVVDVGRPPTADAQFPYLRSYGYPL